MGNIYITYDMGVPQIGCTDCGKCNSIMGRSLCKVKNRGCCHYFPEFTLVDIQRMAVLDGGDKALDIILSCPGTIVNNFNLYSRGHFDEAAYEQYLASENIMETGSIKDHTIFFRTCPFVIPGSGCRLPPRFRTTVCNFFICAEIAELPEHQDRFRCFHEERSRYARWVYRESGTLQHILEENDLNLVSDLDGSIRLLAQLEVCHYEFPELEPIVYDSVSTAGLSAFPSTTSA